MIATNKRTTTTKDIALLYQLYKDDQLRLAPEFQRNSVWPPAAKAYLIDTIIHDRPMPLFFFQRGRSAQSGRPTYSIIDGQQRLTAIFEYLDDRFKLPRGGSTRYAGRRFSQLRPQDQGQLLAYDIIVEELSGYSDKDIRDIFVRMNRFVVKLSPQELRHAKGQGAFHKFVEEVAKWKWWADRRVFSQAQIKRMRAAEFVAELTILLIEGPQDKKSAVDLYYSRYATTFPHAAASKRTIARILAWIDKCLPSIANTRYRKPVDLYALVGAIDRMQSSRGFSAIKPSTVEKRLLQFEKQLKATDLTKQASTYALAASRQTDNVIPRTARIATLMDVIQNG